MSTDGTLSFGSGSTAQTLEFAAAIGQRLKGGEVIELASDLGGGKTTFVRGLAKGAGSADAVSSPSFTLSNEYTAPKLTIAHYDFYRLNEPGIMKQELEESINDPAVVTVVEWAGIVEDVLPQRRLTIHIIATNQESRQFTCTAPAELSYLIEGLAA